ncbi:hypothetical protein Tco_0492447 [Tanacetum coccineum]
MRNQCSLVRADMEKRSRLISELERLAVGEVVAEYLESLRQMQKRDGQKLLLLEELLLQARVKTHERQLALDRLAFGCCVLYSVDGEASSFFAVVVLLEEVYCRISARGGVTVSGVGKLRSGCAISLKIASKVKSGFPGLDLLPKCGIDNCVTVRDKGMCFWAEACDCCCCGSIIDDSLEAVPVIYSDVSCTFLVFVVAVL